MLIDRRLYLPEEWANDGDRRAAAYVPEEVVFRTKPELALEMVADAVAHNMPFRFVTGDSVYGDSPTFVQGIRALRKLYVMDVSSEMHVWLQSPKRLRSGKSETRPISVAEALVRVPEKAWKKMTVAEGSQGPRVYEYAELLVWFSEEGLPTATFERLLFRRSLGQKAEIKYQRSNAPLQIKLPQLAQVGGQRWTIEQDFQAGKGECGLDEYETRGWTGWHHHTALSMLALFFLALQRRRMEKKEKQMTVHEVRALLRHLLELRCWDEDEIIRWSNWRQQRNEEAKRCHENRRRAECRRPRRKRSGAL